MIANKKHFSIIAGVLLILAAVLGFYIFSNQVQVDKEGGVLTQKDALVNQQVSYEKDGNVFKFNKNRLSRTADFEMQFKIADTEEFGDFMGSKVTMAPFLVNFLCSTLNQSFFDPESLKDASDSASTEEAKNPAQDDQFKSALEGYQITSFKVSFVDKESSEQIAYCQSSQKGFENIKFNAMRDYSGYNSFFGSKIGEMSR